MHPSTVALFDPDLDNDRRSMIGSVNVYRPI